MTPRTHHQGVEVGALGGHPGTLPRSVDLGDRQAVEGCAIDELVQRHRRAGHLYRGHRCISFLNGTARRRAAAPSLLDLPLRDLDLFLRLHVVELHASVSPLLQALILTDRKTIAQVTFATPW